MALREISYATLKYKLPIIGWPVTHKTNEKQTVYLDEEAQSIRLEKKIPGDQEHVRVTCWHLSEVSCWG
ncbi:MAG: hypothetical protein LBN08_03675 [Lactobacillales bacterium]|nr:hypothetical protein [Lactobacillales bacterium]